MPRRFRARPKQSGQRITRPGSASYDNRWRRYALAFRRRFPFCAECFRHGRLSYQRCVVDHKVPVADGGAMYPGEAGLWTLCPSCHGGLKRALETHARETDQMHLIVTWCDDPQARPARFRRWRG